LPGELNEILGETDKLNYPLDGVSLESGIERFHLGALRVSGVDPHLGLSVREPIGRPRL
jgi:hypothetical protein